MELSSERPIRRTSKFNSTITAQLTTKQLWVYTKSEIGPKKRKEKGMRDILQRSFHDILYQVISISESLKTKEAHKIWIVKDLIYE